MSTVNQSGDIRIDALLDGTKIAGNEITFSFETGNREVSQAVKDNVRIILTSYIEPLINVTFKEVADTVRNTADIHYLHMDSWRDDYAFASGNTIQLNPDSDHSSDNNGFQGAPGTHGFFALIHETLHVLGLKHPGNYNAGAGAGTSPFLHYRDDNTTNTVMSYNFAGASSSSLMPYDILALQYIYGASNSVNTGNTTYYFDRVDSYTDGRFSRVRTIDNKQTLMDSNGNDTLDFSGLRAPTANHGGYAYRLTLKAGGISAQYRDYLSTEYTPQDESNPVAALLTERTTRAGTAIAHGVSIENLIGSKFNDVIIGNSSDNDISGGDGNDSIESGTGDDTIRGGDGHDKISAYGRSHIYGEAGNDIIKTVGSPVGRIWGGSGNDLIRAQSGNDILYGDAGQDSIYGGSGRDVVEGGQGHDQLFGEDGDDSIWGDIGNDLLEGGSGDDTLRGEDGRDTLVGGNGNDSIIGGEQGDDMEGHAGDDTLLGEEGNDTLNGGIGNDFMAGGLGDDHYFIDSKDDQLVEYWNQGHDRVFSEINHTLKSGFESLFLLGGTVGNGNGIDNYIQGNARNNTLNGKNGHDILLGGEGHDVLWGEDGDDSIEGETGNDFISGGSGFNTLKGGQGEDQIFGGQHADVIWGGGQSDLIYSGSGMDNLYGDSGNDTIDAGDGDDTLDGGNGIDRMSGRDGDDQYIVDHVNDIVIEKSDQGHDRVRASVSFSLSAHIEDLYLQGQAKNGYGNASDNSIIVYGIDQGNILSGAQGNDSLFGEAGNDRLQGGEDSDHLYGGTGLDTLDGFGHGASSEIDHLWGHADADLFVLGRQKANSILAKIRPEGAFYKEKTRIKGWTLQPIQVEANPETYEFSGLEQNLMGSDSLDGYAVIHDFSVLEQDKLQVFGSASDYRIQYRNVLGSSAQDTIISFANNTSDRLAVLVDTTDLNLGRDAVFV